MSSNSGGCGTLILLGLAVVVGLPVLVGVGSSALFCRKVASGSGAPTDAAASCATERGSPCAAALEAFEAAAAADTDRLRARLADPAWLERLPPAATSNAAERGQFYVRMLLGEPPGSIEELRGPPLKVNAVVANTALDGKSAKVGIEVLSAESRKLIVELRRGEGGWRMVPLAAR